MVRAPHEHGRIQEHDAGAAAQHAQRHREVLPQGLQGGARDVPPLAELEDAASQGPVPLHGGPAQRGRARNVRGHERRLAHAADRQGILQAQAAAAREQPANGYSLAAVQ